MKKLFLTTALLVSLSMPAFAMHPGGTVYADVNGLICDFCARALEKVFGREDAVESIDVNMDTKVVTIHFNEDQSLEDARIKELITDAGLVSSPKAPRKALQEQLRNRSRLLNKTQIRRGSQYDPQGFPTRWRGQVISASRRVERRLRLSAMVEKFASAGGGRGHPFGFSKCQIRFKNGETYLGK